MNQPVLFGNGGNVGEWFQTIAVTTPAGSTITVSGGGETQTATGTGTYYAFAVHNKSTTYTITVSMDGASAAAQTVTTGTTSGAISFVEVKFGTINVTLDNAFIGEIITCASGGTTISKTASGNSLVFRVPSTGTWTISGTVSGQTYTDTAVVSDLDTPVSASLNQTVNITATLHGAKNDTISFTDIEGASYTIVFETGETSKTATFAVSPSGSPIVFSSAVANDPDNLSNNYSKTVTVDSNITDVYVMPDNTLYWYGYESADLEDMSTANGWASASYIPPVHNTNYIYLSTAAAGQICGIGDKNVIAGVNNLHSIAEGVAEFSGSYGNNIIAVSKTNDTGVLFTLYDTATKKKYTTANTLTGTVAIRTQLNNTRKANIYALWYD